MARAAKANPNPPRIEGTHARPVYRARVPRSVTEKDLKSAYRKLAKAHHPDQNQDDPKAHAKFAEVSSAYDFLSDKEKRASYDRGEIDADGNPRFAGFSRGAGWCTPGAGAGAGGFRPKTSSRNSSSGFGGQQRGPTRGAGGSQSWDPFTGASSGGFQGGRTAMGGEDINATVTVTLEEAHAAGSVPLRMPTGKVLNVKLPEKVEEGQQIRLKGQGHPSPYGRLRRAMRSSR